MMRVASLDGLRGLAALVVVVHHALMVSPNLSRAYLPRADAGDGVQGVVARAFAYTPLHLLWAGNEAVIIFFVLSGYVLTLPFVEARRFPLHEYYAKRLVRLYLPVFAALAFAVVLRMFLHDPVAGGSWWLNGHAHAVLLFEDVWKNATLVWGAGGATTAVLWSLQWEVLYSLMLPAFLVAVRVLRRWPAAFALLLFGTMALPILNPQVAPSLRYLPVFIVGMWLAFERDRVGVVARRIFTGRRRVAWSLGALVVLPVLLTASWFLRPSDLAHSQRLLHVVALANWTALVVGSAALLVVSVHQPRWRALLERSPMQWLGMRSYGLYLVHEPLLVALAFLTATTSFRPLFLVGSIGLALAVTALFWRVVEQPSIALARRAGRWGRAFDDDTGAATPR